MKTKAFIVRYNTMNVRDLLAQAVIKRDLTSLISEPQVSELQTRSYKTKALD